MFEQFLLQGSLLSVALMVYVCNVMIGAARLNMLSHLYTISVLNLYPFKSSILIHDYSVQLIDYYR